MLKNKVFDLRAFFWEKKDGQDIIPMLFDAFAKCLYVAERIVDSIAIKARDSLERGNYGSFMAHSEYCIQIRFRYLTTLGAIKSAIPFAI